VAITACLRAAEALRGRRYAILSAENPGNAALPPAENAARTRALEARLREAGLEHHRVEGMYDRPEASFLIPDTSLEGALSLAKEFGQESVLFSDGRKAGLVYRDGTVNPAKPRETGFNQSTDNYFSQMEVAGKRLKWQTPVDFETRLDARKHFYGDGYERTPEAAAARAAEIQEIERELGSGDLSHLGGTGEGIPSDPGFFWHYSRSKEVADQGLLRSRATSGAGVHGDVALTRAIKAAFGEKDAGVIWLYYPGAKPEGLVTQGSQSALRVRNNFRLLELESPYGEKLVEYVQKKSGVLGGDGLGVEIAAEAKRRGFDAIGSRSHVSGGVVMAFRDVVSADLALHEGRPVAEASGRLKGRGELGELGGLEFSRGERRSPLVDSILEQAPKGFNEDALEATRRIGSTARYTALPEGVLGIGIPKPLFRIPCLQRGFPV